MEYVTRGPHNEGDRVCSAINDKKQWRYVHQNYNAKSLEFIVLVEVFNVADGVVTLEPIKDNELPLETNRIITRCKIKYRWC